MGLREVLSGWKRSFASLRMTEADVRAGYQRGYQQAAAEMAAGGVMPGVEKGSEGLAHFAGRTTEPYLNKLEWPDAYDVYDEMRRRDPTLRSIVHVTKLLARTAKWKVSTATDKPGDREAGEFLESCLGDMSHTVGDFTDDAFTALPFGWSSFELVYKRREDGRVGWRKLAYRRQSTFDEWLFDPAGGFAGWVQMAPPEYKEVTLPIDKLLHVVFERDGANPEGLSLFETAYESWHYVVNLQVISGIGWQRTFVGLPVFKYKEKPSGDDSGIVETVGKGLQVGAKQYVSVPPGMDFELASTSNGGADGLLRTIQFYRTLMAQMCLADFIMLGMGGGGGSWSLGSDKSSLFLMAVDGFLDRLAEVWNAWGVRRLFEYNSFPGMTEVPQLMHTKVQKIRLGDLGSFIQQIAAYIPLYEGDATWLREQAGMPQPAEDEEVLSVKREDVKREEPGGEGEPGEEDQTSDVKRQPDGNGGPVESAGKKQWRYPEERKAVGEASEAEFAEGAWNDEKRAAIEAQIAGQVQRFMKGQLARVMERASDPTGLDAAFWAGESESLKQEMMREVLRSVLALTGMAVEDAERRFAGGADWGMVNADAARWAREYVGKLIGGITETTRTATQETVATWIETGDTLPALQKSLESLFGAKRAGLIATTEVTRAFDEANDLVRQRCGLPAAAMKAPAHPGCRCYTRPVLLPSGEWVIVWSTARDEVVCTRPVETPWGLVNGCRDLQGVVVSEGKMLGKKL